MGYSNIKDRKQYEADAPSHVTIEKTSKHYKKLIVISWILIVGGLFLLGIPTIIGIVLLIVTKIRIWWHHG